MERRQELQRELHEIEQLLALSAKRIRRQELMIRWLEFDGHFEIAETAKRVLQAFVKHHAMQIARRYKLLIDLASSNHEPVPKTFPMKLIRSGDNVEGSPHQPGSAKPVGESCASDPSW
jgi:hypothetical protein